jgi:hypothetical protein
MVSKCANPECATPFRYFHEGKLFRLETRVGIERRRTMDSENASSKPMRRVEFYWLCERCAEKLTLVQKDAEISVRPRFIATSATAA